MHAESSRHRCLQICVISPSGCCSACRPSPPANGTRDPSISLQPSAVSQDTDRVQATAVGDAVCRRRGDQAEIEHLCEAEIRSTYAHHLVGRIAPSRGQRASASGKYALRCKHGVSVIAVHEKGRASRCPGGYRYRVFRGQKPSAPRIPRAGPASASGGGPERRAQKWVVVSKPCPPVP